MATKTQRAVILIALLVFVIGAVGSTAAVLWQMYQDGRANKTASTTDDQSNAEINETEDSVQDENRTLEGFTPLSEVSELQKIDIKQGDGQEAKAGDTVTAHYTGATTKDGKVFESSKDSGQPATFPLSNVIPGWQEGVPGMKVGGIRRLVIPAAMAYGENGSPPKIGPNEPLVFDIELIKIGE